MTGLRRAAVLMLVLGWALLVAVPGQADGGRPWTMADTLRSMAEAMAPLGKVTVDAAGETVSVRKADNTTLLWNAANLHQRLAGAASAAARRQILAEFVAGISDTRKISRENLFLVVRHRDYLSAVAEPSPSRPLAGDLVVMIAIDGANSLALATTEQTRGLGLGEERAFQAAAQNLSRLARGAALEGNGVYFVTLPDPAYVASLMALPDFWAQFDGIFARTAVSPLARDLLLVTDATRPGLVKAMRQYGAQNWKGLAYPLTRSVFVRQNGAWRVLD